jgi:hypothetical protein
VVEQSNERIANSSFYLNERKYSFLKGAAINSRAVSKAREKKTGENDFLLAFLFFFQQCF